MFNGARFTAGTVSFMIAKFSGGRVIFVGTEFPGGMADFTQVRDWSVPPEFLLKEGMPGVLLPVTATDEAGADTESGRV